MKRNSLSTGLKGYTYKNQMPKEFWDSNNNSHSNINGSSEDHHHYTNGFPWPPRSYTCSFCRKEFKSAQALGGHMNVHRRDRARLRQSSPTTHEAQGSTTTTSTTTPPMLNLNLNPTTTTTNLNFSTSSPSLSSFSCDAKTLKPVTCTLPLFVSSAPSPLDSSSDQFNEWVVVDGIVLNPLPTTKTSETIAKSNVLKKGEILRMDLEIGLPAKDYDHLDLELRLGTYS